ncbi:hypothetical protein RA224_17005 [Achromobacter aegrifaciens]|uniref:hypothetical protein n=1 Tax=Achromobacter aegrifaciens TaxID=1287736 RepID=UPI0027BB2175|nr:hypothetical protein [Achromobacter aegrifaciens]WLW58950.1 hypothetical protein RA224_17005 [Achromobacter aegrifaciens]
MKIKLCAKIATDFTTLDLGTVCRNQHFRTARLCILLSLSGVHRMGSTQSAFKEIGGRGIAAWLMMAAPLCFAQLAHAQSQSAHDANKSNNPLNLAASLNFQNYYTPKLFGSSGVGELPRARPGVSGRTSSTRSRNRNGRLRTRERACPNSRCSPI